MYDGFMLKASTKSLVAEFLGTLVLTSLVIVALKVPNFSSPAGLAALVVGLFVYTVGHISGAQFNPAVTIGLWLIGKMEVTDAVKFGMIQMIAAWSGASLIGWLIPVSHSLMVDNSLQTGLVEAMGTFIFCFGIASVVVGKVDKAASGIVVGLSLFLGSAVSLTTANGVLNPAVAFGIGSWGMPYIWGPIVGGVLGFKVYKWLIAS